MRPITTRTCLNAMGAAKSWLDALLGFFYPEICQCCGVAQARPGQGYVCESCAEQARFIEEPFCQRCGLPFPGAIDTPFHCANCRDVPLFFSYARSAVAAEGLILDVIHRYKYDGALWFEPFLARLLLRQAVPLLLESPWDLVIPVPLHPLKKAERQYNQAECLARHLSRAIGRPLSTGLLRRIHPTGQQAKLPRHQRATNVKGAFAPSKTEAVRGQRIVVVDDVFTTGATTNECARALLRAGAREVCVWTVARGILS